MKSELERIEIPDEHDARERAWPVVHAAYAEREPLPRQSRTPWVAAGAVAVAVFAAALAGSPGRAVVDRIRRAVGVESAQPALFSLPAPGKLLVASDAGIWVVHEDGSRRLLGSYREAGWSPFGRFVVAARTNELAALEPNGHVRWTLARPGVRFPRWGGTRTDTRIAYVDRSGIRIVAGDGTGDHLLVRGGRGPLAWRPGSGFVLAFSTRRMLEVRDLDTGRRLWRAAFPRPVSDIAWSADGRRLLLRSSRFLRVYDARGHLLYELGPGAARIEAATLSRAGPSIAFVQTAAGRSQLWIVPRLRPDASAARRLFTGTGSFDGLAWSPDARWILVTWPAADQWVFVRSNGRGIRAAAGISAQFHSAAFPRVDGWSP